MRFTVACAVLLGLTSPVDGQVPVPDTPAERPRAEVPTQFRVTARVIHVDRASFTRAGLAYLVVGNDRVRVDAAGGGRGRIRRGSGSRVGVAVGTHGVGAFIEAARESRWLRSESTQHVLVLSGREGRVSSQSLATGRFGAARTRGPSLSVVPELLPDGSVRLMLSSRIEDSVTYYPGYEVDGSPVAVDTEVVVRPGQELVVAGSEGVERTREAGLLRWGEGERGVDVLVAVTVDVLSR
jgi:hypothetical protein